MSIRKGNQIIAGLPDLSNYQTKDNLSQELDNSTIAYPSNAAVKEALSQVDIKTDNLTINKNASNEIQAVSLINQNNLNANIKLWLGSEEDYEAVETKDENTVYFTKEGVIDIPGENSGGLEIGDIGIAPFGIDETQNKRRYLNGQVISQSQFVSFTDRIKAAIQLNPNLAATEENWQAEVTNSVLGQCGKFVIDDTLGTIRLPKVINIQGLQDLALLGSIKAESLPNITGEITIVDRAIGGASTGAFYSTNISNTWASWASAGGGGALNHILDASRSSSTYQNNAPVQQEAIQYPYFIQVATGVEESVDVTREIELNNPFSLLDYKWSEYELNNASWLLSNGQFNSGATYISVYNLLFEIYNGTVTKEGVSVKSSTETYEDTDFVLNTEEQTFRLPIKVKQVFYNDMTGNAAVVGNGMTLGFTNGTDVFGINSYTSGGLRAVTDAYGLNIGQSINATVIDKQLTVGLTTDSSKSGMVAKLTQTAVSGLKLYFYVGETIQDANVIAASQVLTTVADCVRKSSATDRETVVGWGMPDYSAGINITSLPYIAPVDGLISILGTVSNGTAVLKLNDEPMLIIDAATNITAVRDIRVKKGDVLTTLNVASATVPFNRAERNEYSMFYPLKGVN